MAVAQAPDPAQSPQITAVLIAGLALQFGAERLVADRSGRVLLAAVGVLLLVVAVGRRVSRLRQATGDRRTIERVLLNLSLAAAWALGLHLVASGFLGLREPLDASFPKVAVGLGVLWPALLFGALLPAILIERVYASMARAEVIDLGRLREALYRGVGVAAALVFAFTAVFVATRRGGKADFAFMRANRPGPATVEALANLDSPLRIGAFFPPGSDVLEDVRPYLEDLAARSRHVDLVVADYFANPSLAKAFGVTGNGTVAFVRGTKNEQLALPLDWVRARWKLRALDADVRRRILQVAKPQRYVYFTIGHGERGFSPAGPADKRGTLVRARRIIEDDGFVVRTLGATDGLAQAVPADAAALLVVGPQRPFLRQELMALYKYGEQTGRILLALDAESATDMKDLLEPWGLRFDPTPLAHDEIFLARTREDVDRFNILSAEFSPHPSIASLVVPGSQRTPVVFVGAGPVEGLKEAPHDAIRVYPVHTLGGTWLDRNRNARYDAATETRATFELVAALTRVKAGDVRTEEARVALVGDSDWLSDGPIDNPANAALLRDIVRWLAGDELRGTGYVPDPDVPLNHTRKEDVVWFYGSVAAAPVLVLVVGFLITRRSRKSAGGAR